MHLVLHVAGLVQLLAWHSSGYAINNAANSLEYEDDFEHVNPHPNYYDEIEYEDLHPLLEEIYRLSGDELDEIMKFIATLQDDDLSSEEEVIRSKRSKLHDGKEDMTEDKVTTDHIVIPEHEKERMKEVQIEENEEAHKTHEVEKTVGTKHEHEIIEMKSMEHAIESIDDFSLKEEEIINNEFKETESMEHVMENVNALLMLEEDFLAEKERGSEEKIERSARNSEWFEPMYPEYPWYPTWYPPYPWSFYQGWPPYFNPYPMAFPVNRGGGCNPGMSDGAKQLVPVKGKVTIAASFTDGSWSLPASFSTPRNSDPCFYPNYDGSVPFYGSFPSSDPVAVNHDDSFKNYQTPSTVINAPITDQGTIPVSGKVTIAAHFPC